ncbi:MAG: hypothetical protein EXX96DRAFT_78210 [Benjaminiella poitrasii]|nr:MAG: hypothetical protein EXX96DRAFT_78210 [Benjaminiella poitrasii]
MSIFRFFSRSKKKRRQDSSGRQNTFKVTLDPQSEHILSQPFIPLPIRELSPSEVLNEVGYPIINHRVTALVDHQQMHDPMSIHNYNLGDHLLHSPAISHQQQSEPFTTTPTNALESFRNNSPHQTDEESKDKILIEAHHNNNNTEEIEQLTKKISELELQVQYWRGIVDTSVVVVDPSDPHHQVVETQEPRTISSQSNLRSQQRRSLPPTQQRQQQPDDHYHHHHQQQQQEQKIRRNSAPHYHQQQQQQQTEQELRNRDRSWSQSCSRSHSRSRSCRQLTVSTSSSSSSLSSTLSSSLSANYSASVVDNHQHYYVIPTRDPYYDNVDYFYYNKRNNRYQYAAAVMKDNSHYYYHPHYLHYPITTRRRLTRRATGRRQRNHNDTINTRPLQPIITNYYNY